MENFTIESLKSSGRIAYEYIRGSNLYGISISGQSDIDIGGVYIAPIENIIGFPKYYQEQVNDKKCDTVYYEIRRYVELLCKSNPTVLESLFVPKDKVIGKIHPSIQLLIDNRDKFLTKECFKPLYYYGVDQIKRARGLNKKIVNPIVKRKGVLDFCFTAFNQGSIPICDYLDKHGLKQEFCGLVAIPNMRDLYGVYYDWGKHKGSLKESDDRTSYYSAIQHFNPNCIGEPFGYKGIVKKIVDDEDINESNEVRLSSIPKGEKPICFLSFNKDGYISHCRDYREYKEWEKIRNKIRYESNLQKNYDAKNVCHCVRLMHMAYELAKGEGFNVVRTYDRDFLIDIRNHKFEYDYLINYLEDIKFKLESAINECTLPDSIDESFANDLLIEIEKKNFLQERS